MKRILVILFAAAALASTPALAKDKGCPPGLAKKNPPCVPPGLAKKGVTADEWSRDRRYDDDDDDDEVVYDRDDLPRYAVTPQGRIIDLERRLGDGWSVVEGITTEDGLPAYVIGPDRRIYSIENRLDDGWRLADPEDLVRLPTRSDNREYYLLDDEVVEIINREGEPYVRLIGALNDILN